MLYNIVKQIVQEGTAMSQKEKKKLVSIKTDDTLMETALHGTHLFPYKLYDDNITVSDCSERKFNLSEICVTLSELIFGLLHFFFFTGMAERNFV